MKTIAIISLVVTALLPSLRVLALDQPNIIFILTDDQRYDELGILNPLLETPNMDALAQQGVHFKNAFVTTALCSPSRATILTGQYAHSHGVVDNNASIKPNTIFFPSYMQQAGYETAFFGKWHMGRQDDQPQPGFDKWVSFKGQGRYFPVTKGVQNMLNVDGRQVPQKGYITDELTDYAVDWLDGRNAEKPFFLYLSHKAVHSNFDPAPRHQNRYVDKQVKLPANMADTEDNYRGKPRWVKDQRNSFHGIDFPYHTQLDIAQYKMRYHRALAAVDDSVGRIRHWLISHRLADNTVVVLMGDNGFMFGEHGLIDKRNAYEESMRVPLLVSGPGFSGGKVVEEVVSNLNIAPTFLDLANIERPDHFEGNSFRFLPVSSDARAQWNNEFVYEYFWEYNYPQTPTTFAIRNKKYKLIQYHGIWDLEELYDMQKDPSEMNNLINDVSLAAMVKDMRKRMFAQLKNQRQENVVPYTPKGSRAYTFRNRDGKKAADFPDAWVENGDTLN